MAKAASAKYGYESIRGWAQGGELVTGGGINGSRRGVSLQAALEQEDSVTVQFNVTGPESLVANIRAVISATLPSGGSVNRTVTVVDGASITVRGMNVKVMVRDYTISTLSSGVAYQVDILATIGVRASNKQPPLLFPLTYQSALVAPLGVTAIASTIIVPAGSTRWTQVPPDSGVNSVYVSCIGDAVTPDPARGQIRVTHDTAAPAITQRNYDPRNFPDWVPLAPNTAFIGLTNISAVEVQFAVTFGVDG